MYEKIIKRALDILLSFFALLVFAPVFLVTAIAIKLSSPGPVFYHSYRAGKNKKPFKFFKFRSMHQADNVHKKKDMYTADRDRLFPVGRVIRKLKIDELPQLLNVLIGDMSIVGPRPMPVETVDREYCGEYADVLSVRPGLTSAASLYDYTVGESYADNEELYRIKVLPNKNKLEHLYIKKQGFSYDASLIWRTIKTIVLVALGRKRFPDIPELREI